MDKTKWTRISEREDVPYGVWVGLVSTSDPTWKTLHLVGRHTTFTLEPDQARELLRWLLENELLLTDNPRYGGT